MRVLLTNDDGYNAPGMATLEAVILELGWEATVVAPDSDCSGAARAITISEPLRMREIDQNHFAVSGKPADCVLMGLFHICDQPPDLILSGVNRGQNVAEDTTSSGTIGAALEGVLNGVPAMAISQAYGFETRTNPHWDTARRLAPSLIRKLVEAGPRHDILYNINFPDCMSEKVAGVEVTRQGVREGNDILVDERIDGRGNPYYWLRLTRNSQVTHPGTDLDALANNKISVTPIKTDLTCHKSSGRLASLF